jgi:hypothetical protein
MSRKLNLARVYAEVEDYLIPTLRLEFTERALYYNLLRHTWLAARRTLWITRRALSRSNAMNLSTTDHRLRTLQEKGCIRIVENRRDGKVIEVLLPQEVPACLLKAARPRFVRDANLRRKVIARAGGRCFYCLRPLRPEITTTDHVVPLARGGRPSEKNLVACCFSCNCKKNKQRADSFLTRLRLEGFLTPFQYKARMHALRAIQTRRRAA